MFTGSYPMTVDAKARVTLPAAFRSQIDAVDGKKTLCLLPMKDCVHGYPVNAFEKYVADLFHHDSEGEDSSRRNRREDTLKRSASSTPAALASARTSASRPRSRSSASTTTSRSGTPRPGTSFSRNSTRSWTSFSSASRG